MPCMLAAQRRLRCPVNMSHHCPSTKRYAALNNSAEIQLAATSFLYVECSTATLRSACMPSHLPYSQS